MSGWIIGILIGTTMVAALIGIGTASVFDLNADQIEMGQEETDRGMDLESTLTEVDEQSTQERILSFITYNILLDMTGDRATTVNAVVIFSLIVGIDVNGLRRKDPTQATTCIKLV